MRRLLFWFVQFVGGAQAGLYQIQDTRPSLASSDAPLDWWAGGPAFTLASTSAVRLNFRGVHTFASNARIRPLGKVGGEWNEVPCNISAWGLCRADAGRVMPWTKPRTPDKRESMMSGWEKLGCSDGKGKVLVSTAVYDISACDIIDEGVDLVYSNGILYHRHTSLAVWRYWTCVALAIVVVRALSYNVQGLWIHTPADEGGDGMGSPERKQWPPLVCSLGILFLVLIDMDSVYISSADQVFFWCSVAYAVFYLLIHGGTRIAPTITAWLWWEEEEEMANESTPQHAHSEREYEQPVFNILVVTLQILAMRLYTGTDTPYNLMLIGMLACRAWTKLLTLRIPPIKARDGLSLAMDSMYLSMCIEIAYSGPRELVIVVTAVAFLAAQLLVAKNL